MIAQRRLPDGPRLRPPRPAARPVVAAAAAAATLVATGLAQASTSFETLVESGDTAPGTGTAGDSFTAFSHPVINDAGQVGFLAATSAPGGSAGRGLWRASGQSVAAVFVEGDFLPGSGVYRITAIDSPAIDHSGHLVFFATVDAGELAPPFDSIRRMAPGGPGTLVASWQSAAHVTPAGDGRQTALAPSGSMTYYSRIGGGTVAADGSILFNATLRGGEYDRREAAFRFVPPADGVSTVLADRFALSGEPAPGTPGGVTWSTFHPPLSDRLGNSLLTAELDDGRRGIWWIEAFLDDGGGSVFDPLVVEGDPLVVAGGGTGGVLRRVREVGLRGGRVVAHLEVGSTGAGPGVSGLWTTLRGGGWTRLASAGEPAPGCGSGFVFAGFSRPAVNAVGEVAFRAAARHPATGEVREGVWTVVAGAGGDAPVVAVACAGAEAPGLAVPGRFRHFGDPELNDLGQLVVTATLADDRDPRVGRWGRNGPSAALDPVIVTGEPLPGTGAGSRLVAGFESSRLSSDGRLALAVVHEGGPSTVLRAEFSDTSAPAPVEGLAGDWESSEVVVLAWAPAADDLGVREYVVRRDGAEVARLSGTTVRLEGGVPGTRPVFTVAAVDFAGNEGPASAPVEVSLPSRLDDWVVDNKPGAGFSVQGDWGFATSSDAWGPDARATISTGATAAWTTDLPVTGWFEIQVWIPATSSDGSPATRDAQAEYSVSSGSGGAPVVDEIVVDQNRAAGAWQTIGAWAIPAGPVTVSLGRDADPGVSAANATLADAVRFVLLDTDAGPPTGPAGLVAEWVDGTTVDLVWEPAGDDLGVRSHIVFRDGAEVARVAGTRFRAGGLEPGAVHAWSVAAVDYAGNVGPRTAEVVVATPRRLADWTIDDTDPGFATTGTWGFASNPDRFGSQARGTTDPGATATWTTLLPATGWFEVQVRVPAADGNGGFFTRDRHADYAVTTGVGTVELGFDQNLAVGRWVAIGAWPMSAGAASVTVSRDTAGEVEPWVSTMADAVRWVLLDTDRSAPSPPVAVAAAWRTSHSIEVAWSPSSDDVGIAEYIVRRDGAEVARLPAEALAWSDASLTPGTLHRFEVEAVDFAGRTSGPGRTVEAATPAVVADLAIDNLDPGYVEGGGFWYDSSAVDAFGIYSRATSDVGAFAGWTPDLPVAGPTEVHVWITARSVNGETLVRHPAADYLVSHSGGSESLEFDQNTAPGGWAFLGRWDFAPGASHGLWVSHDGAFGATIADAARFTVLDPVPGFRASPVTAHLHPGSPGHVEILGTDAGFATDPPAAVRLRGAGGVLEAVGWTVGPDGSLSATFEPPGSIPLGVYDLELVRQGGTRQRQRTAVLVGDPERDHDGDGLPLALELALGTDPRNPSLSRPDGGAVTPTVTIESVPGSGGDVMIARYRRPAPFPGTRREGSDTGFAWLNGFRYALMVGDSPGAGDASWRVCGSIPGAVASRTGHADGTETVEVRWPRTVDDPGRRFVRLFVEFEGGAPFIGNP